LWKEWKEWVLWVLLLLLGYLYDAGAVIPAQDAENDQEEDGAAYLSQGSTVSLFSIRN